MVVDLVSLPPSLRQLHQLGAGASAGSAGCNVSPTSLQVFSSMQASSSAILQRSQTAHTHALPRFSAEVQHSRLQKN